jgi:hypothetical protein
MVDIGVELLKIGLDFLRLQPSERGWQAAGRLKRLLAPLAVSRGRAACGRAVAAQGFHLFTLLFDAVDEPTLEKF